MRVGYAEMWVVAVFLVVVLMFCAFQVGRQYECWHTPGHTAKLVYGSHAGKQLMCIRPQ